MSNGWEEIDKAWNESEPAPAGAGSFDPFPEGSKVKVVVTDQTPAYIGPKGTPCVKTTFEIVEPAEIKGVKAVGRKVWHDFWTTLANVPYLKRDLGILGWKGTSLKALMDDGDISLLNCGADVTLGIEEYTDRNQQTRYKNVIRFFNENYVYKRKDGSAIGPAPSAPPAKKEEFPF